MIKLKNITKIYQTRAGQVKALDGVSLFVSEGEFVTVKGPSGCGKTTLLLTAGCLLPPTEGRIEILGKEPYPASPDRRARFRAEGIGFVFQQFHLIPYLSVLENILCPALARGEQGDRDRAGELIEKFQLTHRQDHVPAKLSVGERQRTALSRALYNAPKILLADEPTGNLDEENSDLVIKALREFADGGGAVLMVTHDPAATSRADRILTMREGRMISPA